VLPKVIYKNNYTNAINAEGLGPFLFRPLLGLAPSKLVVLFLLHLLQPRALVYMTYKRSVSAPS
jgi:hypothetical protein